jgi:hypothetical protein
VRRDPSSGVLRWVCFVGHCLGSNACETCILLGTAAVILGSSLLGNRNQMFMFCESIPVNYTLFYVIEYNSLDTTNFHQQIISIGGLVVKLAVAICFRSIRLAPGSIPGRCNPLFLLFSRLSWWCWWWLGRADIGA